MVVLKLKVGERAESRVKNNLGERGTVTGIEYKGKNPLYVIRWDSGESGKLANRGVGVIGSSSSGNSVQQSKKRKRRNASSSISSEIVTPSEDDVSDSDSDCSQSDSCSSSDYR
jgi:hypothetical protein